MPVCPGCQAVTDVRPGDTFCARCGGGSGWFVSPATPERDHGPDDTAESIVGELCLAAGFLLFLFSLGLPLSFLVPGAAGILISIGLRASR
jgi:hypothetical protein